MYSVKTGNFGRMGCFEENYGNFPTIKMSLDLKTSVTPDSIIQNKYPMYGW